MNEFFFRLWDWQGQDEAESESESESDTVVPVWQCGYCGFENREYGVPRGMHSMLYSCLRRKIFLTGYHPWTEMIPFKNYDYYPYLKQ